MGSILNTDLSDQNDSGVNNTTLWADSYTGVSLQSSTKRRLELPNLVVLFLLIFGAQLAFGMWMNTRGIELGDALSRATSALMVFYSSDPHLAAIGFVWMPLPTLLELIPTAFFPLWPKIVSSGFASTFTTAMAGGANAVLLWATARRLGLASWLGWVYALLISANPMLFLYGSNGMSEGLAVPFLTGTVCFLTLFWHSGQRRYITAAGLALALGFASLYEAVPYGAAVFLALVFGLLVSSENKVSAPQGRWRAVEGLGILFLLPSIYVAALWIGASAALVKDPLYFAHIQYSNHGQTAAIGGGGLGSTKAAGDLLATMQFITERTAPFLIPGGFLLLARALDGRLFGVNTLSLVLLLLSVPFGFNTPTLYLGENFGWLRYFMYPFFVAAGWGLYEMASSKRPKRTIAFIITGWVVATVFIFWAMSKPELGQQENGAVTSLLSGESAQQIGFENVLDVSEPVADYLQEDVMPKNEQTNVAVDAFFGWSIAAQMPPAYFQRIIMTPDRRFTDSIRYPKENNVRYLLVPNPEKVPQDEIVRTYPELWAGDESNFELIKDFTDTPQEWRLYKVM